MKVSRKIACGYAFQLLLIFACGAVGWSVMTRMTKIIEFITGPAWETADGCMEFTIQLQAQVLATKEIMAGVHVAENNERLTEAREAAQAAFAQMLGGKLISSDLTAPLEQKVADYNAAQQALLAADSQVRNLIPSVEQPVAELQAIAAAARERQAALVASTARSKTPTKPIEITLATKLIALDSVLSRTDFPRLRNRIAEILADEEQLAKQQLSGPLGDEKLTTGPLAGQSLRGAYTTELANWHDKLLAIVAQRELWKQCLDTHDGLAHATLALLPTIEEKTDGLLDEMVPIVASTKHYSRLAIICVIGISLVVAVVSCVLITRSITLPLAAVVNSLKDIAQGEGDLTRRLNETRNDELGELARWFNVFVGKLQGIIQRLADNSRALARSSTTVSETSTDLAGVADETKQRSATVAAAAEEMTINMQNMAGSTQAMSNNIRTVASAVEELNITITEVAKNAERAHGVAGRAQHLAETSNTRVADLGQAADGIGKVIEVIQEIAEQTSLLALNATIEAARAGDAGKGFAVVATEVKELAKQTAAATEDIRKRIEGIQSTTRQAIDSISAIGSVVHDVNEVSRSIASAVEEQSIATKEIAKSVAQTASAAEVVWRSVTESASASQEITQSITSVDLAAQRAHGGANRTRNAGVELQELSQQINGLVAQFQV